MNARLLTFCITSSNNNIVRKYTTLPYSTDGVMTLALTDAIIMRKVFQLHSKKIFQPSHLKCIPLNIKIVKGRDIELLWKGK